MTTLAANWAPIPATLLLAPIFETGIAVQGPFYPSRACRGLRQTQLCCRAKRIFPGGSLSWRRRPQAVNAAQDLSEQGTWDRDFRQLERHVAPVSDHLGADFHQLLA